MTKLLTIIFFITLSTQIFSGIGIAAGTEPRVVGRLRSIHILLHNSSVTRRVEAIGNADASQLLLQARSDWQEAKNLHESIKDVEAEAKLDHAVKLIMQAVKISKDSTADFERLKSMFRGKEATVLAFMNTQKRVAAEKGNPQEALDALKKAEEWLEKARALLAEKNGEEALIQLNLSYQVIRVSIFSMRNGATLENPREFASKQEEYAYEFDRNESYRMFVFILLDDKQHSKQVVAQIQALYEEAIVITARAQEMAKAGNYQGGIDELAFSSRLFARAIRLGGVYIPD